MHRIAHPHLLALLVFAGSLAHAAPLIGTTASFANSTFCRDYGCSLVAKDALSATLTEYRYTLRPEFPASGQDFPPPPDVVSVLRSRDTVVSLGFVTGAQDYIFNADPQHFSTRRAARLFELASGVRLSNAQLLALNERCERTEVRQPLVSQGKRTTLVCSLTRGEFVGAVRLFLRVW